MNAWDLADRHVNEMLSILRILGKRGIRVDQDKLAAFNAQLDEEMAALQTKFDSDPDLVQCRGFHPKQGYKKVPKDTSGMVLACFMVPDPSGLGTVQVERWAKLLPFKATSKQQVEAYAKSKGHKLLKTKEDDEKTGDKKTTTGGKALMMMWRKYKDDHYADFVQMKKLKKMKGTYGSWKLEDRPTGKYATTIYTLVPETNRLSSRGDEEGGTNLQTIPKKGPLAKPFRKCLVASPGCKLVSADLSSAEAVIIGWLSGDPLLQRLSRLGFHKYVMAYQLKVPVDLNQTDEALGGIFDELKKREPELYNVIKTVVYGSFYLAGPKTLFEKNTDVFSSQGEVKKLQKSMHAALPAIGVWQRGMVKKYYKWTPERRWGWAGDRLINPFGYSIEYHDVGGSDAPAVCAFVPQSTIGSLMKEALLQLWPARAGLYLNLQIHDDLTADVPERFVSTVKNELMFVMNQPWPQLNGLQIGVEVKVGESL